MTEIQDVFIADVIEYFNALRLRRFNDFYCILFRLAYFERLKVARAPLFQHCVCHVENQLSDDRQSYFLIATSFRTGCRFAEVPGIALYEPLQSI